MAKLTVKPDGAEAAVEAPAIVALAGGVVTDAKGRRITLRELDFLEESRLVRMLGSDASMNAMYMKGYVIPAACVAAIDGVAYEVPATAKEVEASIKRLGRDGFTAIAPALYPGLDGEGSEEDLKNS